MPQFLILADDYTDDEALSRRLSVREQHLAQIRVEKSEGRFIIGGAKLNKENQMHGSMLVVELETEEAVKQWINVDPYVTGKVWNKMPAIYTRQILYVKYQIFHRGCNNFQRHQ